MKIDLETSAKIQTKNRLAQPTRDLIELKPYLTWLIPESIKSLNVDNHTIIENFTKKNSYLLQSITAFDKLFILNSYTPALDLKSSKANFEANLWQALTELFMEEGYRAWDKELPKQNFDDSFEEMSSIILLAEDEMPVYGTNRKSFLYPAIFPSIRSITSDLIANHENRSPEDFPEKPFMKYTDAKGLLEMKNLIGPRPYYIQVKNVFGQFATDPMISTQEISKLLGNSYAREILKKGLIICIVNEKVLKSSENFPMLSK